MLKLISLAFLLFGLVALNQAHPYSADSDYNAYLSGSVKPTYTVNPAVPVTTKIQYVHLNTEFENAADVPTVGAFQSSFVSYVDKPEIPDTYTPEAVPDSNPTDYSAPAYTPPAYTPPDTYTPEVVPDSYPSDYSAPAYTPPAYTCPHACEKVQVSPISVSYSEIPGEITYTHYAAEPDFRRVVLPLAYDSPIAKLHVPISEQAKEESPADKVSY